MKKNKFLFVTCFSLVLFVATGTLCHSLLAKGVAQQKMQRQAILVRTLVVSSVFPNEITLIRGGMAVSATISGEFLNYATAAQVVVDGNVVTQIAAKLSQNWPNPATVTFKAQFHCPTGVKYQLRLLGAANAKWLVGLDRLCIKVNTPQSQVVKSNNRVTPEPMATTKQLAPRLEALKEKREKTLQTADLEKIVASTFAGAFYSANACGGAYANRKTKIQISNYYKNEDTLPRLDEALPNDVKQETTREAISYSKNPDIVRDKQIRACVDGLTTYPWKGFVENGKFKVRMQFRSNLFIKTREMQEIRSGSNWKDRWNWNEDIADNNIPDYFIIALCLDVYLAPIVQNGVLSYGAVEVKWFWGEDRGFVWPEGALIEDPFSIPTGHPYEKSKILVYKRQVMDILKQRIEAAFKNSSVRNGLQHGLTNYVKTGEFSNLTIKEVTGNGGKIIVAFN